MPEPRPDLILASASRTRRQMLEGAGLAFRVAPSTIDEDDVRRALLSSLPDPTPRRLAEELARAKAEQVSATHPGALVIGADQTLELENRLLNKAPDLPAARRQLTVLRARQHLLHSAFALAHNGRAECITSDQATLRMRDFSDDFLDAYLAAAGDRVLWSVGAYELEGLGVQLFESTQGDFFTILGLPLLPLLAELRRRGVLQV